MPKDSVSIPLLGLSAAPICPVNTADGLEAHLRDLIALKALAGSLDTPLVSEHWSTNADLNTEHGALALSIFEGGVTQDAGTGRIDPVLTVDRRLDFSDLVSQGLYAEIGEAGKERRHDEIAIGLTSSTP